MVSEVETNNRAYPFVLIVIGIFLFSLIWYRICYNLVFIGYSWFDELRLAIVFFALMIRLALYPIRIVSNFVQQQEKAADEEHEKIIEIRDSMERKSKQRAWLERNRYILIFLWFQFCFYLMNAIVVGRMFIIPLTPERTSQLLFPFVTEPGFPLQSTDWIPLVGMVDLTRVSPPLNLISAIGAGLVGLAEVILHRKTSRRELLMYLVAYPLGAYFITSQVPSGFEFSLTVFEILTILLIFVEKGVGRVFKSLRESATFNPDVLPPV